MNNTDLIQLQTGIGNTLCDAKAETQIAMAIRKGLDFDDFAVSCDSLFCREYSKDVVSTELKEDPQMLSVLHFHLSRTGIFDHLPEGLFFQPGQVNHQPISAANMAHDYRLSRKKEQEIRRFFQPIENEFFWQRLQLELEEIKLLGGLQSGILNDYFIQFWRLPGAIPPALVVPFVLLLPYANIVAGDLYLMSECLEKLLGENVNIKKTGVKPITTGLIFDQSLGTQKLGSDMICGASFIEDFPMLEFTIGPLDHSSVGDYIDEGKFVIFLETFYGFFVPVGVDVTTTIEVKQEEKNMQLQKDNEPVLGYSSVLGD